MKTTIEVPDNLVQALKLRAAQDGRKLKDVVAELLQRGLEAPKSTWPEEQRTYVVLDERSGLPLIQCQHSAPTHQQLTPERVVDILLEQEVAWHDEAARH
ncbi:MAG TPA: antitoxin [Armatimonadota bacterium]|nr:antitoxin [Armatimonadota bacterium]